MGLSLKGRPRSKRNRAKARPTRGISYLRTGKRNRSNPEPIYNRLPSPAGREYKTENAAAQSSARQQRSRCHRGWVPGTASRAERSLMLSRLVTAHRRGSAPREHAHEAFPGTRCSVFVLVGIPIMPDGEEVVRGTRLWIDPANSTGCTARSNTKKNPGQGSFLCSTSVLLRELDPNSRPSYRSNALCDDELVPPVGPVHFHSSSSRVCFLHQPLGEPFACPTRVHLHNLTL